MSENKDRKQNFEPFHSEIRRHESGFEWTLFAPLGDGSRQHVINLKFKRWWLVYLANDLFKVLEEEEAEVKRIRDLCNWGDD